MSMDVNRTEQISVNVQRYAVASIDSKRCVNCGTCREVSGFIDVELMIN